MKQKVWLTLITCLAYCVDLELYKAIDYLREQVRVLIEQQERDKRILLDNHQRRRLAIKAKRLTRKLLEETTVLFTPDTLLGWYRRLIAQKYDGSTNCKNPGRPRISEEIVELILQFKRENPHWGYTRIKDYIVYLGYKIGETTVKNILVANGYDPEPEITRLTTWKQFIQSHWNVLAACDFFSVELLVRGRLVRCMVLFAIDLSTRTVEILGVKPDPNGAWMAQVARNATDSENGIFKGKRYLIHDRDPLFTIGFEMILQSAGVRPIKLPPKSPNLNAYAERFVRSIKEECLSKLILSSEKQLRHVLSECLEYYHHERIHQGIDRIIDPRRNGCHGDIICIERLGGLLRSYHREAA